jgi:ElaB/YqjD/DUF883 family membrane-anchored ribosome-binding protein
MVRGEPGGTTPDSTAAVRHDVMVTRARMSNTIAAIEDRVSGTIDGAKQKVNVVEMVRQHPWPAITIAFAAGLALSLSGADRRAARATADVAKRAPDATKRGLGQAMEATKSGVSQLVERVKGTSDDGTGAEAAESSGVLSTVTGPLRSQVRELGDEARRELDQMSGGTEPPNSARS